MRRLLPITPLPMSEWPAAVRANYLNADRWLGANRGKRARRMPARLLGLLFACAQHDLETAYEQERVESFLDMLAAHLKPKTVLSYSKALLTGLTAAFPAADLGWLCRSCSEAEAALGRRRAARQNCASNLRNGAVPGGWTPTLWERWQQVAYAQERKRYQNRSRRKRSRARRWSAATLKNVEKRYGRFRTIAVRNGLPEVPTPDSIDFFVQGSRPRIRWRTLVADLEAVLLVAQVLFPGDWRWLKEDVRYVKWLAQNEPPSELPLASLPRASRLRDWAIRGFDAAIKKPMCFPIALEARNFMMMLLLTAKMLRRASLVNLERGDVHFNADGTATIIVRKTKNGDPDTCVLVRQVAERLQLYMRKCLPRLAGRGMQAKLWPSRTGGGLSPNAVSTIVSRQTERRLGARVSPHRFRHSAATTIAEQGGPPALTRRMLGQRDRRSAAIYQQRANTVEAARLLEAIYDPFRRRRRQRKPTRLAQLTEGGGS
jgi:integrase/recombinase XerD